MLNNKYQTQPSTIATYNYTDIAEGTGIQLFYGFGYYNQAGTLVYGLGKSTDYSETIETSSAPDDTGNYSKVIDLDFDLNAFNLPQTARGTAQVNLTQFAGYGGYDMANYIIARIRKWDGTTETEVASGQSAGITTSSNTIKKVRTIRFTVPKTHYKKGDILRLTIELWAKTQSAGYINSTAAFGHDPENRDGALIIPSTDDPRTTTKLLFYCPFNIDI